MPGGPGGGMPPAHGGGGADALITGLMGGDKAGGAAPGNKKERLSNILMNWVLPAAGAYAASYGGGEQRAANVMLAYLEKNKEESKKRKLGKRLVGLADKYRTDELESQKKLFDTAKPQYDPNMGAGDVSKEGIPNALANPMEGHGPAGPAPWKKTSVQQHGENLSSFLKKTPAPVANPIYDTVGELAASGDPYAALDMLKDRQRVIDDVKMKTLEIETAKTEAQKGRDLQRALAEMQDTTANRNITVHDENADADRKQSGDFFTQRLDFDKAEAKDLKKYRQDVLGLDAERLSLQGEELGLQRGKILLDNITDLTKSIYYAYSQGTLELPYVKDEDGEGHQQTLEEAMAPLHKKRGELEGIVTGADFVYDPTDGVQPLPTGSGARNGRTAAPGGGDPAAAGGSPTRLADLRGGPASPTAAAAAAPPSGPPPDPTATPVPRHRATPARSMARFPAPQQPAAAAAGNQAAPQGLDLTNLDSVKAAKGFVMQLRSSGMDPGQQAKTVAEKFGIPLPAAVEAVANPQSVFGQLEVAAIKSREKERLSGLNSFMTNTFDGR